MTQTTQYFISMATLVIKIITKCNDIKYRCVMRWGCIERKRQRPTVNEIKNKALMVQQNTSPYWGIDSPS